MFGFGEEEFVGLDIGSTGVKVALLKKGKRGYELVNFGMVPLPPDTIVDGEVENPTAISEAIKNLLKSEKLTSHKRCVFSVSGQSVIIKKITVPLMSEDDLAESIQQEAEQYIPFDIDEVNVDFQIVSAEGEIPKKGAKPEGGEEDRQMDVLLVAVKKGIIQEQNEILTQAGLKPTVVDLDVFALENGYELSYGLDADDTFALVNIGASNTNVNIIENGITAYTRDMPVGGNTITETIQKNMNVGFRDADAIKLGHMDESITKADAIPHIKQGVAHICEELKSTIETFQKTSDSQVRRIHLCGGTAMLEGIESLVSAEVGLECDKIDPFKSLKVNKRHFDLEYIESIAPQAVIAVGLAIRRLDDK
ncbi:Type IV pilus biogenesis protein PilM [hydrothermal vent metagenome]|uniref:Type IV pilus biogenesis protein PilM n=1 Tax=hydrothermal vent metagenome TaxID=652676 RepID=A0A3B1C1S8_9ZZZZ